MELWREGRGVVATVTRLLIRQPLYGGRVIEVRLEFLGDAVGELQDAIDSNGACELGDLQRNRSFKFKPFSVVFDAGNEGWVRGLAHSGFRGDIHEEIDHQNLSWCLHQHQPGEKVEPLVSKLGPQMDGALPDFDWQYDEGSVVCWGSGTPFRCVSDQLTRELSRRNSKHCGWVQVQSDGSDAIKIFSGKDLPEGYSAYFPRHGRGWLHPPFSLPHAGAPHHPWQGALRKKLGGVDNPNHVLDFVIDYLNCDIPVFDATNSPFSNLARFPGTWYLPTRKVHACESVLGLTLVNDPAGDSQWKIRHYLFLTSSPVRPPAGMEGSPILVRGKFEGWSESTCDEGSLGEFAPVEGQTTWNMARPWPHDQGIGNPEGKLLALIRTPGSDRKNGPHGLYLDPQVGDVFDIEIRPSGFPRAVGGVMRRNEKWQEGVAVLNASQIIFVTDPERTNENGEIVIKKDAINFVTQATLTPEGSNFNKVVSVKPHIEVES